jgi:dCTP deaminase
MLTDEREGILPRQEIKEMVNDRKIWSDFTIGDRQLQPASLDLRLGEEAHRVQSSFLPGRRTVKQRLDTFTIHRFDLIKDAILEPGVVYIIPLMEQLSLPEGIRARANPRSSTGRLDIFTRVITDHNDHFDDIKENYQGPLYLEVLSRSFPIRVKRGMSLSQVRFIRGVSRCTDAQVESSYDTGGPFLYEGDEIVRIGEILLREGLFLRVDLSGIADTRCVGYKARRNSRLIDLGLLNHYRILDFWEPVFKEKNGSIILEKDEFYLLTSKEKVCIPPGYAAEMIAYEQTSGELRTHYAGFFDPGFGFSASGEVKGTVAVMEVRALDAPFLVEDGQRFCKLQLERMAFAPDLVYGSKGAGSSYQFQGLTPSKHFLSVQADIREIKRREQVEQLSLG